MHKSPVYLGGDLLKNSALSFDTNFQKTPYQMTNNGSDDRIHHRIDEIRVSESQTLKVSNPWTNLEGSRRFKPPDFKTIGT